MTQIEDTLQHVKPKTPKYMAPRLTRRPNSKCPLEISAICLAFNDFSHLIWVKIKPVIIMTNSKSTTRFFHRQMILPQVWNACSFVLKLNFTIANVPGKMSTTADFRFD